MTTTRGTTGVVVGSKNLMRRMLQGAVMVAIAASVPAAWAARPGSGIEVNNVASGIAALSQAGNVTTIRTGSQNTIINYQKLSVASGETLNFIQPNATSRVLNRIQGPDPTLIEGSVLSNGRVYFVNPAGVLFGAGAVVNVSGLYAAAGHLSDGDFMAGNNHFTDNTGMVQNAGALQGREVHLVGGTVANFGEIVTTGGAGGVVTMTAGKDVYIGETNSPTGGTSVLVKISSDKSATNSSTGVQNSGKVVAAGGVISMGAGDMYAAGIYNNGSLKGSTISLNAHANSAVNDGTIDASNANGKGGSVKMLGNQVGVFSGTVDASGTTGGGSIKIGGDFHGAAGTQAATETVIGPTAVIKADAINIGDGGEVVVWSSELTRFSGYMSARGGAEGGNGGYVEISGKTFLDFTGTADVSAVSGAMGTILLDPGTITISTNTPSTNPGGPSFTATANQNFNISPTTLTGLAGNIDLEANEVDVNNSVDFTTHPGVLSLTLGAVNDINIADGVTIKTVNAPITLNAGGDITFKATTSGVSTGIYATGTASVTLNAGGDINLQSSNNRGSTVSVKSGSVTMTSGGNITFGAGNNTASGVTTTTGTVTLTAGNATSSGHILLSGDDVSAYVTTGGGDVSLSAWDFIQTQFSTGNKSSPQITTDGGAISLRAGSSITLQGGGAASLSTLLSSTGSGTGGTILLSAGDLSLGGTHDILGLGNNMTIVSGGGNITLRGTDINFLGGDNKTIDAGTGNVSFEENNPLFTISVGGGAGSMTLTNGNLTNIANAGTITIGASGVQAGTITLNQVVIAQPGVEFDVFANAGAGKIIVDDGGSGTGISAPGNVTLAAGTGGLLAANTTNGNPEVDISSSSATLTLQSAQGIGTNLSRFEISDFGGTVNVSTTGAADFIRGLGDLNFGTFLNTAAPTDVLAGGNIECSGSLVLANAVLNAGGGIGTTGAVAFSATGATLTTAGANAAGNIHLNILFSLPTFTISTAAGSKQTVTLDAAGDMAVGGNITLQANDALVLHAGTSGTGNLTFSAPVTLTADSVTLHAGTGGGASAVDLTNLTLAGVSAATPGAIRLEEDATIAALPVSGATTDLTLISHQGNVLITTDQTLKSLTASGKTIVLDGNVTVTGDASLTGSLILEKDITLAGGATSNLTLGQVSNGSGGTWGLTTNFGAVTTLQGDIGTLGNELGSFTVQAGSGTVVLGSGSAVAIRTVEGATTGIVSIGEDLKLNGNTTVTVTGGAADVTFAGKVDSGATHSSITVNTSGITWFQKDVGSGSALGGVTTDAAGSTQLGNGGAFAMSVGSPITFNDDVVLMANTTLTASGAGANVTFGKTLLSQANDFWTLTVNAGGITSFTGDVGNTATQELGGLTVTSQGGTISLGSGAAFTMKVVNAATTNASSTGVVLLQEKTLLNGDTTINGAGGVTLGGLVSSGTASHAALVINSAGITSFSGGFSQTLASELGSITTDAGGTTTLGGTFITTGAQVYNDKVVLQIDTTFQGSSLTFSNTGVAIDAGIQDLRLFSDLMTFNGGVPGSVIGNGNLTLAPLSTGDNIVINAGGGAIANTLVIKASDLQIFSGFATMTIGYAAGTGTLTVSSPLTFHVATTLVEAGAGGAVVIDSAITSSAALTLHAGSITLGADITTNGGDLTLNGPVALSAGTVTLNSAGTASGAGNITVTGAIEGSGDVLTLLAQGTSTSGNINLLGSVGAASPLGGLNVSAGAFTIGSNISTVGNINIGAGHIFLAGPGTIVISTSGGAFNAGTTAIDTNGSGAVSLTITTSASGATAAAPITLGSVGGGTINQMGSLTLIATDALTNADITVADVTLTGSGAFSSQGAGFTNSGVITTANGDVTIHQTGGVTLNGGIAAGTGTVKITGVGVANDAGVIVGGDVTIDAGTGVVLLLAGGINASGAVSISADGIGQATTATISGSSASLNGGSNIIILEGVVNAGSGFTSTSTGAFTLFTGAAINTTNGLVSINSGGTVGLGGAIGAGTGAVTITGNGVTVATASPITGGAISIDAGTGAVSLSSTVHGSGAVTINGVGITQASGATITGTSASLNGGSGAVSLSDAVNAAGGFYSNSAGAFTLNAPNGAINTTNGTVFIKSTSGTIGLGGAIGAGTGSVTISGVGITLAASSPITGGAISLDGGSGAVSLSSTVHGSGAVTISGDGITQASGATITGSTASLNGGGGVVSLSDAVNAAGGFFSNSTGAFTLNSPNGAINTTNATVFVSSGGVVTLNGAVAAGTGAVSVSGNGISNGAGDTIGGGAITLNAGTGAVSLGANVTGGGSVSITGVGITQGAAAAISGSTVALNSGAGTVGLSATVTATNGFTSTGTGVFDLNAGSGITTTNANVTITHTGAANLAAGISAGTGTVKIAAGGVSQTVGIITAGTLVLSGAGNFSLTQVNNVGTLAAAVTGSLSFTNSSTLNVASASAMSVVFTAPTVTGGNITSGTTVTVNGAGNFSGPIAAAGDILITGNATLGGNVNSSGGSATFGGLLSLNANITTAGNISAVGAVDLTSGSGTSILTAAGTTGITLGAITGNHSLTLITNNVNAAINVGAIGTSGTRVNGDIAFESNTLGTLNGVNLGGDIYAHKVSFGAPGGPRADVPKVATIDSQNLSGLIIDATTGVIMEKNQKLTTFGSLLLTAPTLTLGDITAKGTIILDAKSLSGAITFVQRTPQTNVGVGHLDDGVDVVSYSNTTLTAGTLGFVPAGTTIAMRGTVSVAGGVGGQHVEFSSLTADVDVPLHGNANLFFNPSSDPALGGKTPEIPVTFSAPFDIGPSLGLAGSTTPAALTTADMVVGGAVRDGVATGITGNSPEESRVIPRDEEMVAPEENTAITGALRDILTQAGINARDLRIDEIVNDLLHLAVYDDVPYELDPQPKDYRVAVSRLPYAPILPVVDMTRKLLLTPALDANGKPITENGRPKYNSKADTVKNVIGEAWSIYTTDKGDAAKPAEFRAYLEANSSNPKLALALDYLNQLRDLLAAIKNLGLTPKEYDISRTVLLEKLRFNDLIAKDDFPIMVDGPSSLGGKGKVVMNDPAPTPPADQAPKAPETPAPATTPGT